MGWQFPDVSTHGTEFPFDFGLALTPEQAQEVPEVRTMVENPPATGSRTGARRIGAPLKDGLREAPAYIAFARRTVA